MDFSVLSCCRLVFQSKYSSCYDLDIDNDSNHAVQFPVEIAAMSSPCDVRNVQPAARALEKSNGRPRQRLEAGQRLRRGHAAKELICTGKSVRRRNSLC